MRKFLLGLLAGISAGILFAPESGKKLRARLKKSDAKLSDFGKCLLDAGRDAGGEIEAFLKNPEIQKFLENSKKSVADFAEILEKKGGELSQTAKKEFEKIVDASLKKAESAKKELSEKSKAIKKVAEKKVAAAKKAVKKITK